MALLTREAFCTGQRVNVKGVISDQWGISPASLAACGDQQADETRCSYPDSIAGTFNQSLTYQCPTLLSLPHFLQVPPEAVQGSACQAGKCMLRSFMTGPHPCKQMHGLCWSPS